MRITLDALLWCCRHAEISSLVSVCQNWSKSSSVLSDDAYCQWWHSTWGGITNRRMSREIKWGSSSNHSTVLCTLFSANKSTGAPQVNEGLALGNHNPLSFWQPRCRLNLLSKCHEVGFRGKMTHRAVAIHVQAACNQQITLLGAIFVQKAQSACTLVAQLYAHIASKV